MAGPWEAFGGTNAAQPQGPWNAFAVTRADIPEGVTRLTVRPEAKGPDQGVINAGVRGVLNGATANFYDEMRALSEAGGGGKMVKTFMGEEPDHNLSHLLTGFFKYLAQDPETHQKYNEAVLRERQLTKDAEIQHPIASVVGNIGGAMALPLGAGTGAVTLPARMAAGAATGAVMGGAAGVGSGEGAADSIAKGAIGVGAGGILGGIAPAAIEGVVQGGRALATPVANAIRGIRDPEGEAARRVATGLQRDIQNDPAAVLRLTPQEFQASAQSGGPATVMDLGGETTRALARSAANTSPEGRATLNRSINDRFEGQTGRVTDWLRNTFHFPNADAQSQALRQEARNTNHPNYARAMQDGAGGVWDAELQRLAGAPAIQEAARGSIPSLANRGITEGFRAPRTNPLVFDRETGRASLRTTANGNQIVPDLRFWDQVKRNIDAMISKAERYGDTAKVDELTQLNRHLVAHLDTRVQSYAAARAGAAHFFGAQNALEAGQNFVGRNMSAAEVRRGLAAMSPQERQLFQDGFVSKFVETLNQVSDRRTILNKIAESPSAREKLNVALGPQRAQELEAGLRVEGIMDLARNAVQGNSTTARQLAELGIAGGVGFGANGFDTGSIRPSAIMSAVLVYGAAKGHGRINENVSRHVAELLTSQNPQNLIRGIRMVARNNTLFNSLRGADQGLARIGGEQAPVAPALQAAGIGRAEDQPNVPRPPSQ